MITKMTMKMAKLGGQVLSNECYGGNLYQRHHLLEQDEHDDDIMGDGDCVVIYHENHSKNLIRYNQGGIPPHLILITSGGGVPFSTENAKWTDFRKVYSETKRQIYTFL